jgi:hypothetical protein
MLRPFLSLPTGSQPGAPPASAYPMRDHNTSSVYYQNLMYGELRISDTLHKKPCRIGPGLCGTSDMGEHFSGSYTVTSRNSSIHNGATNGTKSGRFDPKGEQRGLLSRGWCCVEEAFATVNFREFSFHALFVNKGKNNRRGCSRPQSSPLRGRYPSGLTHKRVTRYGCRPPLHST